MRNAFVQDWRGFWLVGGLTGFRERISVIALSDS
jgi:hypothetical protein